jgi:hypothetical protein
MVRICSLKFIFQYSSIVLVSVEDAITSGMISDKPEFDVHEQFSQGKWLLILFDV